MTGREDLEKLFEAALHQTEAPSRYGTPESMKKSAPAAFRRPAPPFQGAPAPAPATQAPVNTAFEATPYVADIPAAEAKPAAPAVQRDKQAEASLDGAVNAELAEIMDAKIARNKARRRRSLILACVFFLGAGGAATGWAVSNPERFDALKKTMAEIKSAGDVKGMVAKYQAALDKVGERGKQIDAATTSMGIDPASVDENEDPGFDKEMRAMMGEEGGKTTAARDKILRDKFGDVQKTGSLIKQKEDAAAESGE